MPKALTLSLVEFVFDRVPPYVGCRALSLSLRMTGVQMGRTSIFWGIPTLTGPGDIASRLHIGEACGFNFGCHFELDGQISIADDVSVGHEVMFLTRTYEVERGHRRGRVSGARPIRVESGAWLGSRSVILPGVTVGAGSVIAASVIVRENVAPNTLLTGNRKISIAKWRT